MQFFKIYKGINVYKIRENVYFAYFSINGKKYKIKNTAQKLRNSMRDIINKNPDAKIINLLDKNPNTIKDKLAYIYGHLVLFGLLPIEFIESMTEKERQLMADYITSNFSPDNENIFIIHANL